ncbi:hypothetical protein [Congregibacter sp.]|uniref:hypothetical protein n=1 Tax=Congregibacter sp. TaxID=2744308 RepID=UPI003F6BE399
MILRSLTKHVKDQNWFAVGIDFAIVVIGVFIGIQVANLNDDRQDRIDEVYFLSRILADIDESIAVNESVIDFLTSKTKNTYWVADKLREGALVAGEEKLFKERFLAVENWRSGDFIDSTVQELQSSGRLHIIRSKPFREQLARFELQLEGFRRAQANIADFHKTLTMQMVPYVDRTRTTEFFNELDERWSVREDPEKFERQKVLLTPFGELAEQKALIRFIERYAEFYYWRRDNVIEMQVELKKLRDETLTALNGAQG